MLSPVEAFLGFSAESSLMNFDGAVKNFLGSARHVDAVIVPPFDEKISSLNVDRHLSLGPTGEDSGNPNR